MRIFNRCTKLIQKSVDVFLTPAEDPRLSFPDSSTRQRELLTQVDQAINDVKRLAHQLAHRKSTLEAELPKLMTAARQALQASREDLARLALHRRKALLNEIDILDLQIEEVHKEAERLQIVKQKLETQIEAIKTRQQVLSARYSAAEAQVRLSESLNGISDSFSDLSISLEEAEQKTSTMQSRASAIQDLFDLNIIETEEPGKIDPLSRQLKQLDNMQSIETQLEAIRQEIHGLNTKTPSGDGIST